MLSLNNEVVYCVKRIIRNNDALLNDDEILCEYISITRKYKKLIRMDSKNEIIKIIMKKRRYANVVGNLDEMIEYVCGNRNKYVVKLIAKYPVLMEYASSFVVKESCFLSIKEAQNLYKYFKIFVPEWNKDKLKVVRYDGQCSYSEKYMFIEGFLMRNRIEEARDILFELKNIDNLRIDYKIMFSYLYQRLMKNECNYVSIKLYGIDKNREFKKLCKIICELDK